MIQAFIIFGMQGVKYLLDYAYGKHTRLSVREKIKAE